MGTVDNGFRGRWCNCNLLQDEEGHAIRHWIATANESALHYYRDSQLRTALPLSGPAISQVIPMSRRHPGLDEIPRPMANDRHLPTAANQSLQLLHASEILLSASAKGPPLPQQVDQSNLGRHGEDIPAVLVADEGTNGLVLDLGIGMEITTLLT